MRWVLQRLVIITLVLAGYFVFTGAQVWLTSRHHDARPVQAIVVMGAAQYDGVPSPDLVARLDEASALWKRQLATTMVVTGSKETGDQFTEAHASAVWLEQHGVPTEHIVEVGGNDSWTNLSLAAAALHQRGMTKVLIVTDGFHEDRAAVTCSARNEKSPGAWAMTEIWDVSPLSPVRACASSRSCIVRSPNTARWD